MNGITQQLEKLVRSARKKPGGKLRRFIGVRHEGNRLVDEDLWVDDEPWRVVVVRSPLEARMALVEAGDEGRAVLLTPLVEAELGLEVTARLAGRKLQDVQPWQHVREEFQARRLDPRVVRQGAWMANELLSGAPLGGYPAAPSGLLDLDTAWSALFPRLGLQAARPSIAQLVEASAAGVLAGPWSAAVEEFRAAARERLAETAGGAGKCAAAVLDAGHGAELVPLGLVLDLLLADQVVNQPRSLVVRTRLERYGLQVEEPVQVEAWAREAVRWVRTEIAAGAEREQRAWNALDASDRIVEELGARELAVASDLLRSGFEARMALLSEALLSGVGPGTFAREAAEQAYKAVAKHELPAFVPELSERRDRARDALRLARWLSSEACEPESLGAYAERYRDEGAYVDRARFSIARGEGDRELAAVYGVLAEHANARREDENRVFAECLARVVQGVEGAGTVLPIEEVLPRVVVPLAERMSVLLVVMDGMSEAIAEELVEDVLARSSYERMSPDDQQRLPAVVGLLPSVTEVCRTSLLCGAPRVGAQSAELEGFEMLAAMHGWRGRATKQRILFHKAELTGRGGSLASEVQTAIESSAKVVAVVVNAVDEHLSKGDQLRLDWSLKRVPVLQELVHQAELGGRALVLTSDHGHVVETGATRKVGSDGNDGRWRPIGARLEEGELEVRGARVMLPQPGGPCVLPWSERLRYSNPHAGYHGGAAPQEVVTPLVVLVPGRQSESIEGWSAQVHVRPWWWDGREVEAARPAARRAVPKPTPVRKPTRKGDRTDPMFPEAEPPVAVRVEQSDRTAWVARLFAAEIWESQRKLAGRTPPRNEDVADVLEALAGAGGKLSLEALINRTRFTAPRLRGLLAAMSRLLNVDGYAVLEVDHGAAEVNLDTKLLFRQFAIRSEGGA